MTSAVLAIHDLTIRYGPFVAVDGLCLEVHCGEVFGLLGPNGSGKSSTLSAVAGLLSPDEGEVRILGRCQREDPLGCRRFVGLVPQELAFYEELSPLANLSFLGRLYGLRGRLLRRRVAEALEFVQLTDRAGQPARTLSGGMQRRLNLACALLHEPALLLLDEPTVGLDVGSRDAIFASLRALRDSGRALVFTTHHLDEAEQLCDRVAIMNRGRLVGAGTLAELCAGWAVPGWRTDGSHWRRGGQAPRPADLERVFRELTGEGGLP
jgi:ABC-2 type transport system ATP-binding protein